MSDESGFYAGGASAHCAHCEFTVPLNTALWRMWLHLSARHPITAARLRWFR